MDTFWKELITNENKKEYYKQLATFLKNEYANKIIYPSYKNIYKSLSLTGYGDIKIMICSQDPYINENQANGLAFAVNEGVTPPPSLRNIFTEIYNEYGQRPLSTTLEGWARQGVLLLNAVLTVEASKPFSHRNKGWEKFTDEVIKKLNERKERIVFMLWGNAAQAKANLITNKRHIILKAAHPSPLSVKGFFGCNHFKIANEYLEYKIDWIKS